MMEMLLNSGVEVAYWRGTSSITPPFAFTTKNHTKSLIVDGRYAIVGDRNIGLVRSVAVHPPSLHVHTFLLLRKLNVPKWVAFCVGFVRCVHLVGMPLATSARLCLSV